METIKPGNKKYKNKNIMEKSWFPLYHTIKLSKDKPIYIDVFHFKKGYPETELESNLFASHALPYPQQFEVCGFSVKFVGDTEENILNHTILNFQIAAKEYIVFPLHAICFNTIGKKEHTEICKMFKFIMTEKPENEENFGYPAKKPHIIKLPDIDEQQEKDDFFTPISERIYKSSIIIRESQHFKIRLNGSIPTIDLTLLVMMHGYLLRPVL